jgi:CheY-like chemotaxis protein
LQLNDKAALPEYIIVDLTMPTMNGWEFLTEYQRLGIDPARASKVYVITSSIFESDYSRSQDYPFVTGFISKPINTIILNDILS